MASSIFDSVKGLRPKKNVFNLDHTFLSSIDMGQVVPVFAMYDIIPGSTVRVSTGELTRFQALLSPIMHRIDSYISFWCVPYRLLDPNWNDFISGAMEFDNEEYDAPYFTIKGIADYGPTNFQGLVQSGTLWDFLGYPVCDLSRQDLHTFASSELHLTPRPFVAYFMILKYRYVNENVVSGWLSEFFDKGGFFDILLEEIKRGGDCSDSLARVLDAMYDINPSCCFPHGWNKDYFTSALPFTQVGDPIVLSIGQSAPVTIQTPAEGSSVLLMNPQAFTDHNVGSYGTLEAAPIDSDPDTKLNNLRVLHNDSTARESVEFLKAGLVSTNLKGTADLSQVSGVSIPEFRIANALQSYKELTARIGHRIEEYLLGTFGVVSQDARLQRPQWLASGKVPVNINPVEQTSATDNTAVKGDKTPAGNLTGRATASGFGFGEFTMYAHEDCLILGLLYIQPKTMYGNTGVNKHLTKTGERFDYFHPKFEHIGEQEIKNHELFVTGVPEVDDGTFGYTARYAEYKHWDDEVHGQFNNVLAFWHMGRIFNTTPTLSPDFLYIKQSDVSRPFAVQEVIDSEGNEVPLNNTLNLLAFKVTYKAPMSHYGTPALLN